MDDTGRDNRVEAWFLGGLALVIFGVVIFAAFTTQFGGNSRGGGSVGGTTVATVSTPSGGYAQTVSANSASRDLICQCYNNGFELAGQGVDVQSTSYRTGFSQCRALGSVEGGNAWTAGWEAGKSKRPYDATCRAYKRRRK